jgi:hypothetical protein
MLRVYLWIPRIFLSTEKPLVITQHIRASSLLVVFIAIRDQFIRNKVVVQVVS